MKLRRILILILAFGVTHGASAKPCGPDQSHCVTVGEWDFSVGIGLGVRTNPVVNGNDIPLVLIPQLSYYGQRFFIDNLDIGFTLIERPKFQVNALVTPGGDGLYFFRSGWRNIVLDGGLGGSPFSSPEPASPRDTLGPMPPEHQTDDTISGALEAGFGPSLVQRDERDESPEHTRRRRRVAGMAGLEASAALGPVDWQVQLLADVTGVHRGEELRFALDHDRYIDQHRITLAGGLSWKSADLLEYYYGIRANEATAQAPVYQPGSGVSPFVRLSWSRAVSENWRWQGSFQYDYLSGAVRHSPLIEDNQVVQIFIGGFYHF